MPKNTSIPSTATSTDTCNVNVNDRVTASNVAISMAGSQ